jgi:citrate lyase subunit beta/citryl-CoA lyase
MGTFRTFLFAPANHPRRTEKAFTLGADAVILDLEDACAVSEKIPSRAKVVEAMRLPRTCLGYVRVNPMSTIYAYGDLQETIQAGLDGVVLPKVETAAEAQTADWLITQLERERGLELGSIDLMPIIETALGLANLASILATTQRIKRVAFGAGDFTLDLGLRWSRSELELLTYRNQIALLSRAAGKEPPIDTVWVDLKDAEGFEQSTLHIKDLGYQGKMCIHPDQIAVANRCFTPTPEQVARAQRVVDAFAAAEAAGSSSIQLDGQFIDYPIVYAAQRVLAIHEKIAKLAV